MIERMNTSLLSRISATVIIAGVLLSASPSLASTIPTHATGFWFELREKVYAKPSTLKLINLQSGKMTTTRSIPLTGMNRTAVSGSWISYKKGEDLYVGTVSGSRNIRVAKFTGCKFDSSCLIQAVGFSPSGRYLLYYYEGPREYDLWTGKTIIYRDALYFQGYSASDSFFYQESYNPDTNRDQIFLTRRSTLTRKTILTSSALPMQDYAFSPSNTLIAWSTGGTTESETGITSPSTLGLTTIATNHQYLTLSFAGAVTIAGWTSPTSFVIAETMNPLSAHPVYKFYTVSVAGGKMTATKFKTISTRIITEFDVLNRSTILLMDNSTDTQRYSILNTNGKLLPQQTLKSVRGYTYEYVGGKSTK